jgi:hypothetical protein
MPAFAAPKIAKSRLDKPIHFLVRQSGSHAPRKGIPAWSMEVAYVRDIEGLSSIEIAARYEFHDDSEQHGRGRSRSKSRYRKDGSELLRDAGAWPWAVGLPLPSAWWTGRRYIDALLQWHRDAWLSAYSSLQFGTSRLVGRPEAFGSIDEHRRAVEAYETEIRWASHDAAIRAARAA